MYSEAENMPTSYDEGKITVEGRECSCEAGESLAELKVPL